MDADSVYDEVVAVPVKISPTLRQRVWVLSPELYLYLDSNQGPPPYEGVALAY